MKRRNTLPSVPATLGVLVLLSVFAQPTRCRADDVPGQSSPQRELTELSLAELMDVEVTSASRKAQSIADTAAAVYVVTSEEIRRSGATHVADALRLVPGLHVAQFDSGKWAVSSRGFNDVFSNKMLVLVDGRSVYTPLFGGVFWDAQDLVLADVDRIEVIRGPGATMWGANAVNGVVNIVTMSASRTQGGYVEAILGTADRGLGGARYGGRLGANAHYRAQMKYSDRDPVDFVSPFSSYGTESRLFVAGFRADWLGKGGDELVFKGDLHRGEEAESILDVTLDPPSTRPGVGRQLFSGGYAQARWRRHISVGHELALQTYYDESYRSMPGLFHESRRTLDVDFQHRFPLGNRHDFMWGLSHRVSADEIGESTLVAAEPSRLNLGLSGAFVQDEIALVPTVFSLTLGTKLERNSFTGVEVQPNARALYRAGSQSLWAAVSRGVRTPSRAERDLDIVLRADSMPDGLGRVVELDASHDFQSENLVAYELGYRWSPHRDFAVDLAAFHNLYSELAALRTLEPFLMTNGTSPYIVVPQRLTNGARASANGFELSGSFRAAPGWSLSGWYAWFQMEVENDSDSAVAAVREGMSPSHQLQIRSNLQWSGGWELDGIVHYSSGLESLPVSKHVRLDLRLALQVTPRVELSARLSDLLRDSHFEYGPTVFWNAGEVRRSFYGKIAWRF